MTLVWISQDYSFVADGMEREADAKQVLLTFKAGMQALKYEINHRNSQRARPYMRMHPDHVECSVAV